MTDAKDDPGAEPVRRHRRAWRAGDGAARPACAAA